MKQAEAQLEGLRVLEDMDRRSSLLPASTPRGPPKVLLPASTARGLPRALLPAVPGLWSLPHQGLPDARVIFTALDGTGGLPDRLATLPQLPPHVTSAITFLELSLVANLAFKGISQDCTDSMMPYAEAVITRIQQSLQADPAQREDWSLQHPMLRSSLLPASTSRGLAEALFPAAPGLCSLPYQGLPDARVIVTAFNCTS